MEQEPREPQTVQAILREIKGTNAVQVSEDPMLPERVEKLRDMGLEPTRMGPFLAELSPEMRQRFFRMLDRDVGGFVMFGDPEVAEAGKVALLTPAEKQLHRERREAKARAEWEQAKKTGGR